MSFLTSDQRRFLEAAAAVTYQNPFEPELLEREREALGDEFIAEEPIWSLDVADPEKPRHNSWRLAERLEALARQLRPLLLASGDASAHDLELYEDACLNYLYYRYFRALKEAIAKAPDKNRWNLFVDFEADYEAAFLVGGAALDQP